MAGVSAVTVAVRFPSGEGGPAPETFSCDLPGPLLRFTTFESVCSTRGPTACNHHKSQAREGAEQPGDAVGSFYSLKRKENALKEATATR